MRVNLIRRVKQEFEWESYVRDNFVIKETPSDELRICCFSCADDKFKLYVNPVKGVFNCFKCDFNARKYDVFDFVAKAEAIGRSQAMARLIREYGRTTPEDDDFETQMQQGLTGGEVSANPIYSLLSDVKVLTGMPDGLLPLTARTEQSARFWDYLVQRGLTPAEILAVKFYYSPLTRHRISDSKGRNKGDLANRVVWPVYGGANQLVSWQSRAIGPDSMKYLTAPESELAKTVWPFVRPSTKHAVLCEGMFDCLATRRAGVDAYATFSKKISTEQMLRLKSWGIEEVTVFWDRRDAKREIMSAVTDLHMQFKRVYVCWMTDWPATQDAGNMLAEPQGADMLRKALEHKVDTYDSLEYTKWQILF